MTAILVINIFDIIK